MWRKPLLLDIRVIRVVLHADSISMPAGGKRGREKLTLLGRVRSEGLDWSGYYGGRISEAGFGLVPVCLDIS